MKKSLHIINSTLVITFRELETRDLQLHSSVGRSTARLLLAPCVMFDQTLMAASEQVAVRVKRLWIKENLHLHL